MKPTRDARGDEEKIVTDPKPNLSDALRAHFRESAPEPGPHPSGEELAAYHTGGLPPETDEEIREHLAGCRECAEFVVELLGPAGEDEMSEHELARAWRRQRQRLRATAQSSRGTPRWAAALAALVLAAVGVRLWVLEQKVRELQQPQGDVRIVALETVGATRGPAVQLAPGPRWDLILHGADVPDLPAYRARIAAPDGGRTWTVEEIHKDASGNFVLSLPAGLLPPGRYRIFLSGRAEAAAKVVEFAFEVASE